MGTPPHWHNDPMTYLVRGTKPWTLEPPSAAFYTKFSTKLHVHVPVKLKVYYHVYILVLVSVSITSSTSVLEYILQLYTVLDLQSCSTKFSRY